MGSWNNAKEKADLEKYKVASERVPTPKISQDGYLVLRPEIDGKNLRFALHRLIAVAEYGFDEVCGKDVHHKNGVRWDNRPSNLDVLTRSEHIELHRKEEREETENQLKIHDF